MHPNLKFAAKAALVAVALICVASITTYSTIKTFLDAAEDLQNAREWFSKLPVEVYILGVIAIVAGVFATFDQWWPALRRQMGYANTSDVTLVAYIKELEDALAKLREECLPRIKFDGITQEFAEDRASGRPTAFYLFVNVKNVGTRILERCLVKVERIHNQPSGEIQEIHAAVSTESRFWAAQPGRFALGPQEKKRILLTFRDASDPRNPGSHKIAFEQHTYSIHRGTSAVVELIAVADVGPPDRIALRLSVDRDYRITSEVLPENHCLPSPSPAVAVRQLAPHQNKAQLAKVLQEFFEIGVKERNRLVPVIADFDCETERQRLVKWSDRVVEIMDSEFISFSERSWFKILDNYQPRPLGKEPISEAQMKIQTMWTEKLSRLRAIIDRIGTN